MACPLLARSKLCQMKRLLHRLRFSTLNRNDNCTNGCRSQRCTAYVRISYNQIALYSSSRKCQQLLVRSYGDPLEVVMKETCEVPKITEGNQVVIKFLASPVNPADINTIQGVYAVKPDFPFVPGNESVMEVVETGADVKELHTGDRTIPCLHRLGTWRTMAVVTEEELIKIPSTIDTLTASMIVVNPCTAYRMLKDFVTLKEGDIIIQNCANSGVGQAVIQIAAARGIQTINIVRDRPDLESLKSHLKMLGATLTVTEEELRSGTKLKQFPKPVLAFNGVSGRPATDMMRHLVRGGTMVTYGGMSKQPVTVPVSSLIFNDITLRGFWMTQWNIVHVRDAERMSMLEDLFTLIAGSKFIPPSHTLVHLDNYKQALKDAMPSNGKLGKKQILVFD